VKSALALFVVLLAVPAAGRGQASGPVSSPLDPTLPGTPYTYRPEGRRDPFLSLVGGTTEPRRGAQHPDGPAGIATGELSIRGVLQSRGTLAAMIQGPDNRTYLVRAGDRLSDGIITAVIPEGLVILQDVSDPLSLVKQREVRRLLRSREDARP